MYKLNLCPFSRYFINAYPDFFRQVKAGEETDAYLNYFWIPFKQKRKYPDNAICMININKHLAPRKKIRTDIDNDQHYLDGVELECPLFVKGWDMRGPQIVNSPIMHTPAGLIGMRGDYFKQPNAEPIKAFNRCYWRGGTTHNSRSLVLNYFKYKAKDSRFDLDWWVPIRGRGKNLSIYKLPPGKFDPQEYINYYNNLKTCDVALCIRGDKAWTHSFLDILRAGAIPVCIDTLYHDLGWQHIGIDFKNLFLSFDSRVTSMETIHHEIGALLEDTDRLLEMKYNIRKFYTDWYLTDRSILFPEKDPKPRHMGWGDFIAAKLLEIIENNFIMSDNSLFCSKVKEIKASYV